VNDCWRVNLDVNVSVEVECLIGSGPWNGCGSGACHEPGCFALVVMKLFPFPLLCPTKLFPFPSLCPLQLFSFSSLYPAQSSLEKSVYFLPSLLVSRSVCGVLERTRMHVNTWPPTEV
jgi:hypothetical protein